MPKSELSYPKVCIRHDGKYYIDFELRKKRYRLFNGRKIGSQLNPNSFPTSLRKVKAKELAREVYDSLVQNNYSFEINKPRILLYDELINRKLSEPLSIKYKTELKRLSDLIRPDVKASGKVRSSFTDEILLRHNNNTSYNTRRRHLNALLSHLEQHAFPVEKSRLKPRKQAEVMHKPIDDLKQLLTKIKAYNQNLHLCCLLSYGCLLRPHREIRLLSWKDFSEDLSYIHLSGGRVKGKKNRIVPVPSYIKDALVKQEAHRNIFTGSNEPYNVTYFSNLWSRFKRANKTIGENITIYSFRHTGAIEIFKRTGSITKLQKAMGHSSINVSLTYLRGLEIPELNEEDMPMI